MEWLKNVEDTKRVFKSHRSKKDRQSNDQKKRTKEQTLSTKYYGTVKTEQHDPPPNKKKNKKGKIRRWTQKYFPKIIDEVIKFTKQI